MLKLWTTAPLAVVLSLLWSQPSEALDINSALGNITLGVQDASDAAGTLLAAGGNLRAQLAAAEAALAQAREQIATDQTAIAVAKQQATVDQAAIAALQQQVDASNITIAALQVKVDALRAVVPAPSVSLTAEPATIMRGEQATLKLMASYTDTCIPNGWSIDNSIVKPATTTVYKIACIGLSGASVVAEATVAVTEPLPSPPPPPTGVADTSSMALALEFADGKRVEFQGADCEKLDSYRDALVEQERRRCRAEGKFPTGDYRNALLAFLAQDTNGKYPQAILELGTENTFSTTAAPKPSSGVRPQHLFVPPKIQPAKVAAGTAQTAGSFYAYETYVDAAGNESTAGGYSNSPMIMVAGDRVTVRSPPPAGNFVGWNLYARNYPSMGGVVLQNAAPIPLGTDWVAPDTGVSTVPPAGKNVGLPTNLGSKTVTVKATLSGGSLAASVVATAPNWYWSTVFRVGDYQRPIVVSPEELVQQRMLLPLSAQWKYAAALPYKATWRGPMDVGPLVLGEGATGERAEIGPETEWFAAWAVTKNADMEATWRAAAEASGSMQFHVRDRATGAPVDLSKPAAQFTAVLDAASGRYVVPAPDHLVSGQNTIALDSSHFPNIAFGPWAATHDPFFLEASQFAANFGVLANNFSRYNRKLPCLVSIGQPRDLAWSAHKAAEQAGFLPDNLPGWMLPRSYWKDQVIGDTVKYAVSMMAVRGDPIVEIFHTVPVAGNTTNGFMADYQGVVFGWIKWTGKLPELDSFVDWMALPLLALSDPNSAFDWDKRVPTPYYAPLAKTVVDSVTGKSTVVKFTSWKEAFDSWSETEAKARGFASAAAWIATWKPDELAYYSGYYPWRRAALAALSLGGIAGAREAHDAIAAMLAKYPVSAVGSSYKWAIPPEMPQ